MLIMTANNVQTEIMQGNKYSYTFRQKYVFMYIYICICNAICIGKYFIIVYHYLSCIILDLFLYLIIIYIFQIHAYNILISLHVTKK